MPARRLRMDRARLADGRAPRLGIRAVAEPEVGRGQDEESDEGGEDLLGRFRLLSFGHTTSLARPYPSAPLTPSRSKKRRRFEAGSIRVISRPAGCGSSPGFKNG